MEKINEVIEYVPVTNITELNDTFFVSAEIVTQKMVKNRREYREPSWKKRLKGKVLELQKDISKGKEAMNRRYNDRMRRKLEKKYNIKRKGFQLVLEELKQRLTATAAKIKRYEGRVKQYQLNRLFENNQKRFYEEKGACETTKLESPETRLCARISDQKSDQPAQQACRSSECVSRD